jgi:hypothetical protein
MPGGRGGLFVTIADNSRITGYLEGMPLERTLARSLSAVSEAPTSEDLSFRCAVKGRFGYSTKTSRISSIDFPKPVSGPRDERSSTVRRRFTLQRVKRAITSALPTNRDLWRIRSYGFLS